MDFMSDLPTGTHTHTHLRPLCRYKITNTFATLSLRKQNKDIRSSAATKRRRRNPRFQSTRLRSSIGNVCDLVPLSGSLLKTDAVLW